MSIQVRILDQLADAVHELRIAVEERLGEAPAPPHEKPKGPGPRGRHARTPSQIPAKGWKDILKRIYSEIGDDRITLIAAGATYYLLLALFPALAAFVSLYGFVADPTTIAEHIAFLGGVLPSGGMDLLKAQLDSLASQDAGALSFGFILGLLLALWSANNGVKTLFDALNIAYDEVEKRSFIQLNALSLAFTFGVMILGIVLLTSVGIVPAVLAVLRLGDHAELLISLLRWPVMLVFIFAGITIMYRFGPSRDPAKWRWLTWGAALATGIWVAASVAFSYYLSNFADYEATYGSLGAVIGFMVWTWLSVLILLLGAELNSELEHQTAVDTTKGPPRPMGMRGAHMADHLGEAAD